MNPGNNVWHEACMVVPAPIGTSTVLTVNQPLGATNNN